MGTQGAIGTEQQKRQYTSSQLQQVRTIFLLCCCTSTLLLLPSCWRVMGRSFDSFHSRNKCQTKFGTGSSLTNPEAKSYLGVSVRESSRAAAAAAVPRNRTELPEGEKYMWYSPHEGFSNQARELENALKIAFLLNRTLVLPPVLDHFEVKQGTCLSPLRDQRELRKLTWTAVASRFNSSSPRDYVSIADIIDLSSITPTVKTIDLRLFLALWCGIDISATCFGEACHFVASDLQPRPWGSISSCAAQFFSTPRGQSGPNPVHEVHDDCRTTTWTYKESASEKTNLERFMMERLRNDINLPVDVNASSLDIKRKDVVETLGPASPAGGSFLLMFGTLYSRRYNGTKLMVDITPSPHTKSRAAILTAIERQTFSVNILDAGQYFVMEKIKEPFFCAHVRLEDGIFVHDQESNVLAPLRQRLDQLQTLNNQPRSRPLNIFVMTDLPQEKWQGTYLNDLNANPNYIIHTMDEEEELLIDVSQKIHFNEYGFGSGFLPQLQSPRDRLIGSDMQAEMRQARFKYENPSSVRLFVEEVVCSCATLGFQGTLFSTISYNILKMREAQMCPL